MIDVSLTGKVGAFAINASFCVPMQGTTAICGPSGSGKTTLLRAIAGLSPLHGHVKIGDDIWQDGKRFVPSHKRRVGYVFQEPSLLPHLSVQDNLDFARKRNGGRKVDEKLVGLLGLSHLLNRSVFKLSGGESQRVALARTLFSAPDIVLMDEPLSSLDDEAKDAILPLIAALSCDAGLPIIYVSHDAHEIERLADRTLRMSKGQVFESPEATADTRLDDLDDLQIRALAAAALKAGLRV